jgi:hypothetical protein
MAALSALQSVSAIVDCIKFCHEGYCYISDFINSIKEMGTDVADLEQRYREEKCRMWSFALAHNLVVDEKHQSDTVCLDSLPPYWVSVVNGRFVEVRKHMEEATNLVIRYVGDDTPPVKAPAHDAERAPTFNLKKAPTESPSVIEARTLIETHVRTLQKSKFQLKFSWSLDGKKKLDNAVEKLERDNDILWNLTAPNILNSMFNAVASRMSTNDLKVLTARISTRVTENEYAAQRQIYDQRRTEQSEARNLIDRLDEESKDQKLARLLDVSCFQEILHTTLPDQRTRTSTTCCINGKEIEVLVEWKEWDEDLISRDEVIPRVSDIVAILKSPPSSLNNILSSPGFFEDSRSNSRGTKWIGIAYDTTPLGYHPKMRTLRDLLVRPEGKPREIWKPALGDRFRLAHQLANTLLAVHGCGWLHKGLRPENILFFSSAKSVKEPYLLGWDYSRSAEKNKKTEPVVSWNTDAELYQDPRYFEEPEGDEGENSRFRIEFDQYQLGCVLLEIGLWCLIGDLKKMTNKEQFSGSDWREVWKEYLKKKARFLALEMGKIYSDVVLNLLEGLDADGMEYWDAVVLRLGQCRA